MGEAHDVHGVERLLEIVLVLLAGDGQITVWQEAVVVESFKEEVGWKQKGKERKKRILICLFERMFG